MIAALLALLLQATAPPAQVPEISVQLGVRLTPDTVTVGERFVAIVKVHAPPGATIDFPQESDSAAKATATATQMIGKPAVQMTQDSTGVIGTAAYRFAAWDVGPQDLGIDNIVVHLNGKTGYVSLAANPVFVRSVLPADTTKRIPRPPRNAIEIKAFDWLPWLIGLAAVILAVILWRL